jgi:hypothetical protein
MSALRLFATVPNGFIAHAVTDRSCEPLLSAGEVAVITDQEFLYPVSGGWYLIEYSNGTNYRGRERRVRTVVQVYSVKSRLSNDTTWWARRPSESRPGTFNMSDGPYDDLNHLAEKILGRIVGIYAPHRIGSGPTDQEQWEMLRDSPWPYSTPTLPSFRERRSA